MTRTLLSAILLLLACIALVAGVEHFDARLQLQTREDALTAQLRPLGARLQQRFDSVVALNRRLAANAAKLPEITEQSLAPLVARMGAEQARVRSIVITRDLKVVFVRPEQGNESVIGLDYSLYPEFMGSINRAIQRRDTVIDAPRRLLQTGKNGLIVRTPIFDRESQLTGLVAMALDIEGVLVDAGMLDPQLPFFPVVIQSQAGRPDQTVFGDIAQLGDALARFQVELPDGQWEVHAVLREGIEGDPVRSRWIRGVGALLTLALLLWFLHRTGFFAPGATAKGSRGVSLRALMLVAVLVPVPLFIGGAGWLSLHASQQVAERLEQQQAAELARQMRLNVTDFFEIPRRVSSFVAELFRQGLLDPARPDDIINAFLAQLRQQPLLTVVSLGTDRGDYYAASRPPLGVDKTLRVLQATLEGNREMTSTRVDLANRATAQPSVVNPYFDARTRHWYQAAVQADGLKWYEPYRYAAGHTDERYEALGVGMAAPVYDAQGRFSGVITADVALSQLGEFLGAQVASLGGVAFIADADGNLLASSADSPVYRLDGNTILRIRAEQSDNLHLRAAGQAIRDAGTEAGTRYIQAGDRRYLLDWQAVPLPDGPVVTIGLALPESRFADPTERTVRDIVYLTLVLLGLGLLFALAFTFWLSQPLVALGQWARRLGAGEWRAPPPSSSPIREINELSGSLGRMATQLQRHAEELEHRVVERTEALQEANRKLAEQSVTDGLTGIANRRHFDEFASAEFARSRRSGLPMALMMLDVDRFKPYNDNYGHQAGDEALKRIAAVLSQHARRPGDLAARYGGEEFAFIASGLEGESALQMAERLRAAIEDMHMPHEFTPPGVVTASIGVAVAGSQGPASLEALIGQADAALYRAKQSGRNRVEMAASE